MSYRDASDELAAAVILTWQPTTLESAANPRRDHRPGHRSALRDAKHPLALPGDCAITLQTLPSHARRALS
jgi:hypothetical protein